MAHFARINENNIVVNVHVVNNDALDPLNEEQSGIELLESIHGGGKWVQTSYNSSFRVRFAGIGYSFHPELGENGVFIAPQPYPSWELNSGSFAWEPPVPMPPVTENQEAWVWDENAQNWYDVLNEAQ